MVSTKKKVSMIASMVIVLGLLTCVWAVDIIINIKVSPNVLNIGSKGEVVTVHTDIAYSAVVGSTVTLNGVEISHWKSDDRGNFVAKFLMEEIKALFDPEKLEGGKLCTLTLTGNTGDYKTFSGSQDILVVNKIPRK